MKKFILLLLLLTAGLTFGFGSPIEGPYYSPTEVTISGGTINNTIIGGTTPVAGSFTSLAATSLDLTDDDWVGLASDAGRIDFDDSTTDEVNIMAANVGINDSTPSYLLDVNGKASLCSTTKSVSSTPITLTADEVKNATIFVSFASTITLPAGASALDGACTTFQSTAAVVFSVEAGASDLIVLNGTALDDGDKITSSGVAGETVTVVWDHTGDRWRTIGVNGIFVDGGA